VDTALEDRGSALIAPAFDTLPERWRTVLWHTEVEGESPSQVGPLLGLTPNGVLALAYRAREGLRQAYLQVHLLDETSGGRCRSTMERLGSCGSDGLSQAVIATGGSRGARLTQGIKCRNYRRRPPDPPRIRTTGTRRTCRS
jgi:hypothetical protein